MFGRSKKAEGFLTKTSPDTIEDESVNWLAAEAHRETIAFLDRPAAKIAKRMNTYFALARPSPVQALMATAKRHIIKNTVAGYGVCRSSLDCGHFRSTDGWPRRT